MSVVPVLVMAAGGAVLAYAYNVYLRRSQPTVTIFGSSEALTYLGPVDISLPEAETAYETASNREQVPWIVARMLQEGQPKDEVYEIVKDIKRFRGVEKWEIEEWVDPQVVANQPHLHNRGKNSV